MAFFNSPSFHEGRGSGVVLVSLTTAVVSAFFVFSPEGLQAIITVDPMMMSLKFFGNNIFMHGYEFVTDFSKLLDIAVKVESIPGNGTTVNLSNFKNSDVSYNMIVFF